jgi:hypothetical protein
MENTINGMSLATINEYKIKYASNKAIMGQLAIAEAKALEAENKAKLEFEATIKAEETKEKFAEMVNKLASKIVFPEGIVNFIIRNTEVEIPDTNDSTKMVKVWKPVITVNHACEIKAGSTSAGGNKAASTKRGITVKHINGNTLDVIGNFRNASEACKHLKLEVGANSAVRVLESNKYTHEAYDGADYLIK